MKFFSLCYSNGYLWNLFVYVGKQNNQSLEEEQLTKELGISYAVVPKLMSELYG